MFKLDSHHFLNVWELWCVLKCILKVSQWKIILWTMIFFSRKTDWKDVDRFFILKSTSKAIRVIVPNKIRNSVTLWIKNNVHEILKKVTECSLIFLCPFLLFLSPKCSWHNFICKDENNKHGALDFYYGMC